jgi:acetyl-CoA C-acetyltransferase
MLIFTALSVTREIERGTMESLLSMPITPVEVMLGKILPYVLVGFIQAILIIGIGVLLFGVPVYGSLTLLALLSTLFITTNLAIGFVPQGIGADLIATLAGWDREDVDRYALTSQQRAAAAQSAGRFDRSVIPVDDELGLALLERDEFIKPRTTLEGLAQLKVAFAELGAMGFDAVALARYPQVERIEHVHTAGNSSGIVDGAAAVLIGSEAKGRELGLSPRGRVVATALSGADPTIMLTGPMPATRKALAKAGLTIDDIDLFEVNEAFAVVPMRFMREMGVPHEKVNVNGGAIAMGHPLGATGAMLVGTLLDELERRQLKRGLVTMCVGGGMGIATVVERV